MQEDERRLPVAVSAVTQSVPKPYLLTITLILGVIVLGLFLLASRSWFQEAPTIVGVWGADVVYEAGERHSERFEFRLAGSELTGSATFRGIRRVIENARMSDDGLSFRTRTRERVGNEQRELVHDYVGVLDDDAIRFELRTTDGLHERDVVQFEARRQ